MTGTEDDADADPLRCIEPADVTAYAEAPPWTVVKGTVSIALVVDTAPLGLGLLDETTAGCTPADDDVCDAADEVLADDVAALTDEPTQIPVVTGIDPAPLLCSETEPTAMKPAAGIEDTPDAGDDTTVDAPLDHTPCPTLPPPAPMLAAALVG